MSFQGKFRPYAELVTGNKVLSDEYTCANARFVRIIANTTSRTIEVRRGPDDADAGTLVGSMQLRSQGDTVILEKHPTDVLVYGQASAVKVGRVGP